jgi:hypothetical protein
MLSRTLTCGGWGAGWLRAGREAGDGLLDRQELVGRLVGRAGLHPVLHTVHTRARTHARTHARTYARAHFHV